MDSVKGIHFCILTLAGLLAAACSRSTAVTQESGQTVSEGDISFKAPKDWNVTVSPMSGYPVCSGPTENNFTPVITLLLQNSDQSVSAFVELYLASLKAPIATTRLVSQKSFQTTGGVNGIRLVVTDKKNPPQIEQISYLFKAPNGTILVIYGICRPTDNAKFEPIYDASLKTLTLGGN